MLSLSRLGFEWPDLPGSCLAVSSPLESRSLRGSLLLLRGRFKGMFSALLYDLAPAGVIDEGKKGLGFMLFLYKKSGNMKLRLLTRRNAIVCIVVKGIV